MSFRGMTGGEKDGPRRGDPRRGPRCSRTGLDIPWPVALLQSRPPFLQEAMVSFRLGCIVGRARARHGAATPGAPPWCRWRRQSGSGQGAVVRPASVSA